MANKKKNTKKKKTHEKKDSFIYLMLSLTLTVLLVALNKTYSSFGVIILPIIFFINNYIDKEFGHKDSTFNLIISGLAIIMYSFLLFNLLNRVILVLDVLKEISVFIISLVINNIVYRKKIEKSKEKKYAVFTYILVTGIYFILYIIF